MYFMKIDILKDYFEKEVDLKDNRLYIIQRQSIANPKVCIIHDLHINNRRVFIAVYDLNLKGIIENN